MTYTDDNHQVARILKDFDERLSNLEEKSRSSTNPNLLRTLYDRVEVADGVITITEADLTTARWNWNAEPGETDGGWQTATWGTYESQ